MDFSKANVEIVRRIFHVKSNAIILIVCSPDPYVFYLDISLPNVTDCLQ